MAESTSFVSRSGVAPGWHLRADPRDPQALDRLADAELAFGHHAAAERLAWLAAELRETAA